MPRVFISYSHDTPAHKDRVLALSDRLRRQGVDCHIDQYEQSPAQGWPLWCETEIEQADFVLVACTETYFRRFRKEERPAIGKGAIWEGHSITQELYDAQGLNAKFVPITFSPADGAFVPKPLKSTARYGLFEEYDALYRRLTKQPFVVKPQLGGLVAMPAREPLSALPSLDRAVWQVPFPRNQSFSGREQILADVRATLEKDKIAALSGLGGVGKTQTAVEFAYRRRADYSFVFWVKAEERNNLLSDFAAIASALGLPSAEEKQQEAAVAAVRHWLNAHSGWLLILDNADNLDLAKEFLPTDPRGHILLTTRARAMKGLAERVEIDVMEPKEGALLLLRRSGSAIPAGEQDEALALKISRELGGLPLALDQAGAFIKETPSSFAEYLHIYGSRKFELLSQRGGSLGDHPSVTVTFSLAFETVERKSAAAADLIRLCACLAPDAIPEVIFVQGASRLGENLDAISNDPLAFSQALKEAGRFSLLQRDVRSNTLDIHRLVQAVVLGEMTETERQTWAERAVRAINATFPDVEFANWTLCESLLPHARVCAVLIEEHGFEFLDAARLLGQIAYYLDDRALFGEAEPLYRRSLAIYEKALGRDHPEVARSLNNLAGVFSNQGKFSEAEPLHQRSLAIREKALGPDHPEVAASLNNLAALFRDQGKYGEAEPLYQRSLAIWEKALGRDHPEVATSLNNLASLFADQGKYGEAEPLYQRSLAIWKEAFGPDHPNVATSLNNLALLFAEQGRYSDAEPLYRRSLAIRQKALGPDHPYTKQVRDNLEANARRQRS
jgi:tetratricopeptide (TPR) repeat protein